MKYQDLVNVVARTQPPRSVFKPLTIPSVGAESRDYEFIHCIVEDGEMEAHAWAQRVTEHLRDGGNTSAINPGTPHQVPVFLNCPINIDNVIDGGFVIWTVEYAHGTNAEIPDEPEQCELMNANQRLDGTDPDDPLDSDEVHVEDSN